MVLNEAPYAAIIEGMDEAGNQTEFGRRPGAKMPPFDALRTWVVRVLGTSIQATVMTAVKAARKGGEKISAIARAGRQESAIDQATWAIGRAIARRGIKAKAPLQTALKANEKFIEQAFDDASVIAAKEIEGV